MLEAITSRICNLFRKKLNEDMKITGNDINNYCKKFDKYLILSIITVAISLFLSFKVELIFLFTLILPLFIIFHPIILEKSKKEELIKEIEKEIPIFVTLLYIDSILGKSLYQCIESIKGSKILKGISKEAVLLEKSVKLNGISTSRAIVNRSRLHKRNILGSIYSDFIDAESIGVSLSLRARQSLEKVMNRLKENYSTYIQRSSDLSEILFSFFLLLPIMLISFQLAFNNGLNVTQLIAPLLVSPLFYFAITSFQPSSDYLIKFKLREFIPFFTLSIGFAIPLLVLGYPVYAVMLAMVFLSFPFYLQVRKADSLMEKLPSLLDRLSDYTRVGYSLRGSILRIIESSSNDITKDYLISFVKTLDKKDEFICSPSWTFNAFLEALKRINILGFIDEKVFIEMSSTVQDILNMRNSMKRNLQLFTFISVLTPLILHFSLYSFSFLNFNSKFLLNIIGIYVLTLEILYSKISRLTIFNFPLFLITTVTTLIVSFIPLSL
ncbi:membrane pilin protein UpsF [Sulfuracidifex metallicus]|uniref:membrane pilin protein UpsF n=1 Tax=Sulfuracidifex metallicus TaxID=47303 RepID=UPI0022757A70|nr:hypothetical protein [Sulfuracidifex metallicus]MCY0849244.1 hypothetical protein [Sulfuracidifex metallicus]